ncbi:Gfo/Idh/MocA family oxidoreductase [Streptomyces sp. SDT5-1]|uniref:Gfo/Idh/MocA family oxidoreductase n=1 Tax=Streptomyces sp. SDT5-1 TaxID=3406418 RepID=UPI003FD15C2A
MPADRRTVRIGVIGAGWIGREHIRRLTDVVVGARVTAVTDIDAERAAEAARYPGAAVHPDGASLIASPDVDAVVVTSSGPSHAEHVLTAIATGKPVFCEKPLATTAADCLKIVEAERAHGRRLVQVGFMRRFDLGYRQMKEVIDAGRIGTPLMVHCAHRNASSAPAYTSDMAALDTAVHEIDVLRWLLADEIVSAQVILPRPTTKKPAHLVDPQFMLFETAKGVRVDLEVFVNCRYGYDIQCEAVGEDGLVRLPDPAAVGVRTAGAHSTAVLPDWTGRFADAFDTEFREWVAGLRAGHASTGPSAWDGYAATVITGAAVESRATGRVVTTDIPRRPDFYDAFAG